MKHDLFISHASEDKQEVAQPLAEKLQDLERAVFDFHARTKNVSDAQIPCNWLNLIRRCRRNNSNRMPFGDVCRDQSTRFGINSRRQCLVVNFLANLDKHLLFDTLNAFCTDGCHTRKIAIARREGQNASKLRDNFLCRDATTQYTCLQKVFGRKNL